MAFTVAVDGPAAAGKGTISRALAAHFGFGHLDSGLLYRAVGRRTLDGVEPVSAAQALLPEDLDADGLRTPEVAAAASKVAALPGVRAALVDFQRAFARRAGGAVIDGRDIGTVICPDAEAKLFVTASDEVRAQRRFEELIRRGLQADLDKVLAELLARDARDRERESSPMVAAEDAVVLDTTHHSIESAIAAALEIVERQRC